MGPVRVAPVAADPSSEPATGPEARHSAGAVPLPRPGPSGAVLASEVLSLDGAIDGATVEQRPAVLRSPGRLPPVVSRAHELEHPPHVHPGATGPAEEDLPPIRVLSIDGGAAEGLAAAKILQHVAAQSGRAVHELFDVVTGTGMGSLVVCVVFGIRPDGRPLVPAAHLVSTLLTSLPLVFSKKKRYLPPRACLGAPVSRRQDASSQGTRCALRRGARGATLQRGAPPVPPAPSPPIPPQGPLEGVLREAVGDLRLSDLGAF
eukprot:tig00000788_g4092.t1